MTPISAIDGELKITSSQILRLRPRFANPAQLSDFDIETLRSGLHLRKFAPYRDLVIGEKVRIKAGTLTGLAGVLVRTMNGLRAVLTLEMIKQSVAVELDAMNVEPLGSRRAPNRFCSTH
jgi:transcription antitermination factor NusG